MALAVAIVVIVVLLFVVWIAFAREPGPGAADVAIAYENAWDRLDFDLLYDLSGEELRDHMRRERFVEVKRAAYATAPDPRRLHARVVVEEVVEANETAIVITRVTTDDGEVRNNVVLEKRAPGWLVVGYSIRT
jgi:hypothetical protein